ncbi:MAG: hypothetical protein R3B54_11405 [Bdellovibrionota bacterium]
MNFGVLELLDFLADKPEAVEKFGGVACEIREAVLHQSAHEDGARDHLEGIPASADDHRRLLRQDTKEKTASATLRVNPDTALVDSQWEELSVGNEFMSRPNH